MQILLAISVLCIFALVWVSLSIARYVNSSHSPATSGDGVLSIAAPRPHKPEFRWELVAAATTDNSTVIQQLKVPMKPHRTGDFEPVKLRATELHQSAHDISANKSWNMPAKAMRSITPPPQLDYRSPSKSSGSENERKPHQALRRGISERMDRAYFNKDAGDLTDPYEIPRTGTNPGNTSTKQTRQ